MRNVLEKTCATLEMIAKFFHLWNEDEYFSNLGRYEIKWIKLLLFILLIFDLHMNHALLSCTWHNAIGYPVFAVEMEEYFVTRLLSLWCQLYFLFVCLFPHYFLPSQIRLALVDSVDRISAYGTIDFEPPTWFFGRYKVRFGKHRFFENFPVLFKCILFWRSLLFRLPFSSNWFAAFSMWRGMFIYWQISIFIIITLLIR